MPDRTHPLATVTITSGAESDLDGIYRRRLGQRGPDGTDGADGLLHELVGALESLAEFSSRGPVVPELESLGIHDFRQLSHPPYRIIYLPEERNERAFVTVMIVADGRRDFRTLLQERVLRQSGR